MGQRFNTKHDTETIRLISDNPSITCGELSAKLSVSSSTVQARMKRMCEEEKRVFKQTRNAVYGKTYHFFTMAYARKNKIQRIYKSKPDKTTLEQQLWFNDLTRGLAL